MRLPLLAQRSARHFAGSLDALPTHGHSKYLILLTAFIQLLDAAVDCMEGRWIIVPGVLIFGLLFFFASARLSGHPFWRKEAWSQTQ
jgi:uncharacterized membrane protein